MSATASRAIVTLPNFFLAPRLTEGAPIVSLDREHDALVLRVVQWLAVAQFAHAVGHWRPAGTDLPQRRLHGPETGTIPKGSYFPAGQTMSDADARALARGFRRAWAELPGLIGQSDSPRGFSVEDPRLWPALEAPDSLLLADLHALDIENYRDEIATFLDWGGPIRLHPDVPREVRAEWAAVEATRQRAVIEYQRDRLIAAISRGVLSEAEAAPQLHALRTQLQSLPTLIA